MKISICTPTYNEKGNILKLYTEIKKVFEEIKIEYEHVVIDNNSDDGTIEILKDICKKDKNFKVIINQTIFGGLTGHLFQIFKRPATTYSSKIKTTCNPNS